jgi:hypothetical protein
MEVLRKWECREGVAGIIGEEGELNSFHEEARRLYRRWDVPLAQQKGGLRSCVADRLGARIDGDLGLVTPQAGKACEVLWLTVWCLGQRFVSRKTLQILAGQWCHFLQFRREASSLLSRTWSFIGGE